VLKKVLLRFVAFGFLGVLGFGAFAWRSAIAPITPPVQGRFGPELVAKGAALAGAGYCAECHTRKAD
jgi:hypothetical protein